MKIYQFLYCDCIHESSYTTLSLHKTKEGAELAMNTHKELKKIEHEKSVSEMVEYYTNAQDIPYEDKIVLIDSCKNDDFGTHEDWDIGEQELFE